ncbi:zinc finger BED domain-containing protein RICESLEEPER 2-like protein [Tanacetum coccineum]|uniref:Zinc finger BED domain-containing protein RICESLEEPER 2-like protein n=1 Tax=Tanacetum coccineum TaxID=301880 RepID=A0ABQ4ZSN4_9ASTR
MLESNSVNQTPIEVDNSDMKQEEDEVEVEEEEIEEEEVEQPKGRKKTSPVWMDFDELKLKKDNNWNLVKKVLNFCRLDGHRGIDIGKGVENCLNECGFTNILSIFVDNASSNDIAIRSIESIRCVVKWIKKSGTRIEKFNKCAQNARCESTKSLVLDCPTRWNSTYNKLEVAHEYKDAFAMYDLEEVDFGLHIVNKDITLRISGTKYVTSHTLVNELATIRALLRAQLDCDIHGVAPTDKHLYDIATAMKPKFENYYGEVENMNLLVYFAFILA